MGRARENATYEISAYTPTWTAATTNPAIGNGTIVSRYMRRGKIVTATINLTSGSTTTYGSGAWSFTLPFTADTTVSPIGVARLVNSNGITIYTGHVMHVSSTNIEVYIHNTTGGMSGTSSITWEAGDTLRLTLTYEAAA